MSETYTYTARSADDPRKVVTFTVMMDYLHINPSELLEAVTSVRESERHGKEAALQVRAKAPSMIVRAVQRLTGPFPLGDVTVKAEDDRLSVTAWQRVKGLRLAPLHLEFKKVDNPDAAHAFASEVKSRKVHAASPAHLVGPFDYWGTWAGLTFAAMGGLAMALRRDGAAA